MNRRFGTTVTIEYTGYLPSGEVFDENEQGRPLDVVLGESSVPKGLELALMKMELGEERTVTIDPDQGYGEYLPEACFRIPVTQMPQWRDLPVGEYIEWYGVKGNERPAIAKVVGIEHDHVIIDLNHPLAGQTVTYRVKVVGEANC